MRVATGRSDVTVVFFRGGLTNGCQDIIFNQMVKYSTKKLDLVFSALSDPTRRAILEQLSGGDSTVTELAEPHRMSLPAVSKHLQVLERAGLVEREVEGRVHMMHLESEPLKDAVKWLEHYRRFWEGRFDALEKLLTDKTNTKEDQ